jgi:hypothetical protein
MSFLDKARSAVGQARATAARVAAERGDTIRSGLDKAGQAVDRRTGGKHGDRIQKLRRAADTRLTGLAAEHARTTRQDPVSADARVVGDDEVAAAGVRAPGVDERDERARSTVPDGAAPYVGPAETDPEVTRARGSRLYSGTAPGGVSPEAPRPDGETPGGPAPGSSR